MIYISGFLIWMYVAWKCNSFNPELNTPFRIQNGLLSLFLIEYGIANLHTLSFSLLHPSLVHASFYMRVGELPPEVVYYIRIASAMANVICLPIGFQMIKLEMKGFRAARVAAPILCLVNCIDHFISSQRFAGKIPQVNLTFVLLIGFVLMLVFSIWIYVFSNNQIKRSSRISGMQI